MISSPLNKSRTSANKTVTPVFKDKDLQKVAEAVALIRERSSQTKIECIKNIEQAKVEREAAEKKKEVAETIEDLDAANDEERRQDMRIAFWSKKLDKWSITPEITEKEYNGYISSVESVVSKAAENYRKITKKAMAEVIAARKELLEISQYADNILEDLDQGSKYLQSIHREKKVVWKAVDDSDKNELKYFNTMRYLEDDPDAWRSYVKRFNTGAAYWMATHDDKLLAETWRAIHRALSDPWGREQP